LLSACWALTLPQILSIISEDVRTLEAKTLVDIETVMQPIRRQVGSRALLRDWLGKEGLTTSINSKAATTTTKTTTGLRKEPITEDMPNSKKSTTILETGAGSHKYSRCPNLALKDTGRTPPTFLPTPNSQTPRTQFRWLTSITSSI